MRGLTEEQFTRQIESSFPSIRAALAHMAFAEWLTTMLRQAGAKPPATDLVTIFASSRK